MDHKVLRSLTCCLLVLSLAGLVRADRGTDQRNEAIPPNHQMRPPVHRSIVPSASGVSPTGYTPQQLRHAYGFDKLATTGAGQTIAIVDAYGSPTIQADLNSFCATFGLPATTVAVYYPQGQPAADRDWAAETTLDVEWAHAIAPGATIVVVIAKSALSSDLLAAVDYAVGLGAKQISMSWSGPEFYSEATTDHHFNVPGVSFFASSGDSGAGVSFPASSPYVVAVGGTSLFLDSSSHVSGEFAWSGSSSGLSAYQPIPAFQIGWLGGAYRNVPDVAYDADPSTGVPVYQTGVGWAQYGGTSMSAPQWAALFALANSLRSPSISSAPNALYSLATTNDAGYFRGISSGSNGLAAGPNYDLVTGLGVPVADQLVLALAAVPSSPVATPVFSPPAGVYSGPQNVAVASAAPGDTIRTTTLPAVASAPGFIDRPIASTVSTINPSPVYTVTKLSAPGSFFSDAFAINDNQQVTIRIQATPNDGDFAFIYRSGNWTKIADLPGGSGNFPESINNVGQVVGIDSFPGDGSSEHSYILDSGTLIDLGTLPGASRTLAYGVNNLRQVVGYMDFPNDTRHPFLWNNGTLVDLGTFGGSAGEALAINNLGQVVGYATGTDVNGSGMPIIHACLWSNGIVTDLFSQTHGLAQTAYAISNTGVIAGVTANHTAFVYNSGVGVDIGTLGGAYSSGYGINDEGKVVGYASIGNGAAHAFVYSAATGMQDLNSLVALSDGVTSGFISLDTAKAINNLGQIVGNGTYFDGVSYSAQAFLLEPNSNQTSAPEFNPPGGNYENAPTVTMTSATAGASIRYTTDGSTPTATHGTSYSGPLHFTQTTTLQAIAYASGYTDSAVTTATYTIPPVPAPAFSPAGGTYPGGVQVSIAEVSGPTIRYTTDGSTPTATHGTSYTGPLHFTQTTTLQAIAYASGYTDSAVTTATYTIPPVPAPVFSPAGGAYPGGVQVSISDAFGCPIRYTTDGSTPTATHGTSYTGPLHFTQTTALQAIAYASGYTDSAVTAATYKIPPAAMPAPTFSPAGGTFQFGVQVFITDTPGATICYTTDGSTPTTTHGTTYSGPIFITQTATLQAIAYAPDYTDSAVTAATYKIPPVPAPVFNPAGGTYPGFVQVNISGALGVTIRYTTDGSIPTETNGTIYTGPLYFTQNTTLQAIAYAPGYTDSAVASATYTIALSPAEAPTFNPADGSYINDQSVTISSPTPGASIIYTIDGSEPTKTHGISYNGTPVAINSDTTLQAIAFANGYTDSAISQATYTFYVAPVAFSVPAGTYSSIQSVALSTVTDGATIRYTTDGSAPATTNGIDYTGPVSLGATTNLQAIALKAGYADSTVNGATYVINLPPAVAPVFTPAAGTYASGKTVTITSATAGATLCYTTDGSTPTETNGMIYSGPVTINSSTVLKAIAYGNGLIDSAVTGGRYAIAGSPVANLNVLYDFVNSNGGGYFPGAALIKGRDGNFYGTTVAGGSSDGTGTVFKITPTGILTTLASFGGALGNYPEAALIQGRDGNFYGTTSGGDALHSGGTIFMVKPTGTLVTLAGFNGTDGNGLYAGLVQGNDGNFYGTTYGGGSGNAGTVFRMTPAGVLTTLVSFDGTNGYGPFASLVQGRDGNLYGTTQNGGGETDAGTVFRMTPAGILTTLVSFNGANGFGPRAALIQGSDGNFYGTTQSRSEGSGTVFRMTPAGVLTTLVSFNGSDDTFLFSALIEGSDGNFYGTTTGDNTTIFRMTPAGIMTTLAQFDRANGADSVPTLVQGSDGNLYGTTDSGGTSDFGVVFQLILPPPPVAAPIFSPAPGTYPSPQTVTIASATVGAAIRYTVDGSTPTETNGILYSGAVTINANCTLRAIAYKSGLSDSSVTSGDYSLLPVAISMEADNLSPKGVGAPVSISSDADASGGKYEILTATAANQQMVLTTPALLAGTYQIQFRYKTNTTRGRHTVKIDGAQIGGTIDQYSKSQDFVTVTLGTVSFGTTATHTILLTVTGKNASATQYYITADAFTFSPVTAAPSFDPPGGAFASAQLITIASATSGASIQYTTDGSTPTATHGTVYSGPVSVTTTTTLKAIAYKAGYIDSDVASATYSITPPTLNFEAETLGYTASGATASVQIDANCSGGKWVELAANSGGDSIAFTVPNVPAGTYQLKMQWKSNDNRGSLQLSVDGTNLGSILNQYTSGQTYPTTTFGTVTFQATGSHVIRLTVTGKNKSSSSYLLSADKFILIGQ